MNELTPDKAKPQAPITAALARTALWDTLLGRYGHGAVQLAGEDNALYERHLSSTTSSIRLSPANPRTFRGLRPLHARCPVAALGA